ncbi:hypothetical protein ACN1T9_003053 [Cronobacter sakazakii]|uniref:hypothetical protein n=1 Tax=Cronobacter sakazakii TaxID=28141 RepID=UPI000BE9B9B4|nr:hypothetical protein [Cronobacter sakazakii]EKC6209649.1 hypothetical protein [Cronobacter sakazakii]EKD3164299.1 hypothetical protein [Cronobacter sakazakii]EKD3183692.1 hypothetical protein [Cronobacter sakazakii]EKD3192936.1 hypothetical protein [Cronobacter sakazakii]EKD3202291.1 hypothetical protein [Cronobacter sakazakii]
MMNKDKLILGLDTYIQHQYFDMDSFGEPLEEVSTALSTLSSLDPELCLAYSKRILTDKNLGDPYLDGACLRHIFDLEPEYAINYVSENVSTMHPAVLSEAMYGLCLYNKISFRKVITSNLIHKIYIRYDELAKNDFAKEVMALDFNYFHKDFSRVGD